MPIKGFELDLWIRREVMKFVRFAHPICNYFRDQSDAGVWATELDGHRRLWTKYEVVFGCVGDYRRIRGSARAIFAGTCFPTDEAPRIGPH